jgi:hypothetical protein
MRPARVFLGVEALVFAFAALFHGGVLAEGYEHREARIAEGLIAVALTFGLVAVVVRPAWTLVAALAAQGFALIGTVVGAVMIAIGIGPRSAPDVALHATMLALLTAGLVTVALRAAGAAAR